MNKVVAFAKPPGEDAAEHPTASANEQKRGDENSAAIVPGGDFRDSDKHKSQGDEHQERNDAEGSNQEHKLLDEDDDPSAGKELKVLSLARD